MIRPGLGCGPLVLHSGGVCGLGVVDLAAQPSSDSGLGVADVAARPFHMRALLVHLGGGCIFKYIFEIYIQNIYKICIIKI